MAEDKPLALTYKEGGDGYPDGCVDIIKEHFNILYLEEYLKNPSQYNPKIQAILIWNFLPEPEPSLLKSLPSLKVVANGGVGVDHLDIAYITSLGIKVTNTPEAVSDPTADLAMGLVLASARNIVEGHRLAIDPKITSVPKSLMGIDVTGSTLGIIGMGRIGYKIAQRSKGFNMKVIYYNRNRRSVEEEQAVGATYCSKIDDLLKEADFVVVMVYLSPETTGLIGHRELSLMKPTGILINISRGLVVDQDALVKALTDGTIRGAALDVTHPEPLPRDHPLLFAPNVIITPHLGSNTYATTKKMVKSMVENALAAVTGKSPPDEVKAK